MAEWYYQFNGENQGPVSQDDLKHIFDSGALPMSTPVWCEGMGDWDEAKRIPDLLHIVPFERIQVRPETLLQPVAIGNDRSLMSKWVRIWIGVFSLCGLLAYGIKSLHANKKKYETDASVANTRTQHEIDNTSITKGGDLSRVSSRKSTYADYKALSDAAADAFYPNASFAEKAKASEECARYLTEHNGQLPSGDFSSIQNPIGNGSSQARIGTGISSYQDNDFQLNPKIDKYEFDRLQRIRETQRQLQRMKMIEEEGQ